MELVKGRPLFILWAKSCFLLFSYFLYITQHKKGRVSRCEARPSSNMLGMNGSRIDVQPHNLSWQMNS